MSPRNSDFPDYKGIRAVHIDFDASEYHSHQPKERPNKAQNLGPTSPLRPKPIPVSKPEPLINEALKKDLAERNLHP